MENYLYTCQYCGKDYLPKRRVKQKYCSNSCRTRAFVMRKLKIANLPTVEDKKESEKKSESMSWHGVGNAAAGTLAVNALTSIFTREENKPATKKDIQNLLGSLKQRYQPVLNLAIRPDGAKAFYDLQTQSIVYLKRQLP